MRSGDWKDPDAARAWTANPHASNPTRALHLDMLLDLLADHAPPAMRVLELGVGSGLVAARVLERFPGATLVGVDSSEAMLALARERLAPYGDRAALRLHDLYEPDATGLPDAAFDVALNVQALHNMRSDAHREVMRRVPRWLRPGGLFYNVERVELADPALFGQFRTLWERSRREIGTEAPADYEAYRDQLRASGDTPLTLDESLACLREAGMRAACLHLDAHRALIVAKTEEKPLIPNLTPR